MSVTHAGPAWAPPPAPPAASRRGSLTPSRVLVVLIVLALVWAGTRALSYWHDRAPYSASAVAAHASVRLVPVQRAQAAVNQLVGPDRLNTTAPTGPQDRRQVVVGQVKFRTPRPRTSHGEYVLFVLDKLTGNAPVSHLWGVGPPGSNVGQGWESDYNNIAHRYVWLSKLASVRVPDGWTEPGKAVVFAADTASPVTFSAVLDSDAPETDPARRVTLALVFLSDSGHPYWAERLRG